MAASYKRLPGRGLELMSLTTLWEAEDHLLYVESNRLIESYKRFFYRDIQAIIICQTRTGQIVTGILGLLTVLLGLLAFLYGAEAGVVLGVIAGIFFLIALINFLRGPTCKCTIQTAVQTQKLSSLNRVRVARKVIQRLQPRIMAAQSGGISS